MWGWLRSKKALEREQRPAIRVRPDDAEPVRVQIIGTNSIDVLHARDLSLTGVGVYVPHRFQGCDIDSPVELVISLPRRRTFVTRGVIKHVSRQGEPTTYFGVEFARLREDHHQEIERFIEHLLNRKDED